jgi:Glycosyl transferases group 1
MFSALQTLRDRAASVALQTIAATPPINEAWAIEPEELDDMLIRWPITYQWPSARIWVDTLLQEFRRRVQVNFVDLPQPYRGTVIFQFVVRGKAHDIAIDYSDYPEVNLDSAARCPLYFKMQHLREGYGIDHIIPGGYVCDSRRIYLQLQRIRRLRDQKQFAFDVYGRFSTEFARATRTRAVEMLAAQSFFKFEGGLNKVNYVDFLREIARASICIDLPGEGDLCFRLINYLAVGACIVGPRPRTTLHVPLQDRVHVAYASDDLSDLVDTCRHYLENETAREEMCLRNRRFFDQYLHKDNLSAYYLRSCLDRLAN